MAIIEVWKSPFSFLKVRSSLLNVLSSKAEEKRQKEGWCCCPFPQNWPTGIKLLLKNANVYSYLFCFSLIEEWKPGYKIQDLSNATWTSWLLIMIIKLSPTSIKKLFVVLKVFFKGTHICYHFPDCTYIQHTFLLRQLSTLVFGAWVPKFLETSSILISM